MNPAVPDHELIRRIGRGSYGEVWLAHNRMGAWRAVKRVQRGFFDSERPFEREFRGIQRYEPISRGAEGVVPILQVGRSGDEFHYVMELADDAAFGPPGGPDWTPDAYDPRTLRSDLRRLGRLPVAECLELGLSLAAGLAHLHRHGLAHRDLKPSNLVFIHGRARLADPGLVGGIDESRSFVGTLGYIPPEGPGSVAADLFALGRVLYEAVTGLPPEEFPNPPPEWMTGEVPTGALELHEVLLRACDPDPTRRHPSAIALQADLALLRSGQSVRAARRLERRVQTLRRAGAAAAAAALVATVLVLVAALRARSERANAEHADRLRLRAENAERDARQRLAETQIARAGLLRRSGGPGQRLETLDLLREAAPHATNLVELRTEAVAAHALPDLREVRSRVFRGPPGLWCTLDAGIRLHTRAHPDGSVWVHAWEDDRPVAALEDARAEGLLVWPFDAAGTRVAGLRGRQALVWDTATGRRLHVRDLDRLVAVDLLPDGSAVLMRTADGRIHIDRLDGRPSPGPLQPGFADGVFWASPDGASLAWASPTDCTIQRVGLDGSGLRRFQLPPPACPQNFLWTPDSQGVVVAGDDFRGYFFRFDRPQAPAIRLSGHQAELVAGAAHPTAPYVLSSSWDGTTRLWSLETGRQLLRVQAEANELRWSRDGRVGIVRRLGEGEYRITEHEAVLPSGLRVLTEPVPPRALSGNKGAWDVAFVAGGKALAVATYDGVRLWPLDGGEPRFVPLGWSRWLEADPTGSTLWVSGSERVYRIDLRRDDGTGRLHVGNPVPQSAAGFEVPVARVPADGSLLCVQGGRLARLGPDGLRSLGPLPDTTSRLTVSPDGRWLACGDYQSKDVQLLTLPSMEPLRTLRVGVNPHVLFLGDGEEILVTAPEGLRRERTRDGTPVWTVPRPDSGTASGPMALDPSGRLLAVAPARRDILLLRADTGERLVHLEAPDQGIVSALEFSPDGIHLAAATGDHATMLWNVGEVRAALRSLDLDWKDAAAPMPSGSPSPPPAAPAGVAVAQGETAVQGPVDLSAYFTHTLAHFHSGSTDNRFGDLRPGPLTVDGVRFDVRGVLQLGGNMVPMLPRVLQGLPVHRIARRLHFLHASAWDGPARGEIGHYLIHYADGATERIPLVHGENIRDWWVDPRIPTRPTPAWTGANPHLAANGLEVGLYHLAWDNPRPDEPVAFLTFATEGRDRLPFLIGFSTE